MGFLSGKRALIVGIASQRSIATGIAEAMYREGAELAFTYQNDKLKSRVEEAAKDCGSDIVLPLDVAEDAQIDNVFAELGKRWDGFDILVHSVGFAPREAIEGEYLQGLTRENFRIAHDISSYSLAALAKAARPMMKAGSGFQAKPPEPGAIHTGSPGPLTPPCGRAWPCGKMLSSVRLGSLRQKVGLFCTNPK